jgi:hypothetical protein
MRAFLVIGLAAAFGLPSLQGQTLADFARQERERQAHLKPTQVITGSGSGATAAPSAQPVLPKTADVQKKPAVDPVKEYNDQVQKLRAKIQTLRDEETATQLQINEINNQVYAPVVDQAAKDQALTMATAAQQKLSDIRKELDVSTKELQALEAQGPPKVSK